MEGIIAAFFIGGAFCAAFQVIQDYTGSIPPRILLVGIGAGALAAALGIMGALGAFAGAGTGILTAALLSHGANVYAVEPNAEMRAKAEARFCGIPAFHSVSAGAEVSLTGLTVTCTALTASAISFGVEITKPTVETASMQQHMTARPTCALCLLFIASTANTAAAAKAVIEIAANNIFMRI